MKLLNDESKIFISKTPVDMRKSIDGLSFLVSEELDLNPQDNALYIFYNKARDKIKMLYWHHNGFFLFYKRLEKGKFKLKHLSCELVTLSQSQLDWLLVGLDFNLAAQIKSLDFNAYF